MTMTMKTLIVGFGNVLRGDDGFGVEVVKRLACSALPPHVEILDVGISGMHFILKLMEGFTETIVVDAIKGHGAPGTLYIFPPAADDLRVRAEEQIDPHVAEPVRAMQLAAALGILPAQVTLVGCEPEDCEVRIGLTRAVDAAVERAVETIRRLLRAETDGNDNTAPGRTVPDLDCRGQL
jgi:hydrogenase maturation protease